MFIAPGRPFRPGFSMNTIQPINATLRTTITLAELLQRAESSAHPIGAIQYQRLVRHLARLLDALDGHPSLDALLKNFPAAAAVYENQRYERAGLCRSPLEASLNSELQARATIDKARAH